MEPLHASSMNHELALSVTSSDAWRTCHQYAKSRHRNLSLGNVAKQLGMKSSGYLVDVMKGRRVLHPKYRAELARILALNPLQQEFVLLLCEIDDNEGDGKTSAKLQRSRRLMAKQLLVKSRVLPKKVHNMVFAFEVFAAFGLYKNEASRDQLRELFGRGRGVEIESALKILLAADLIEAVGTTGRFRLISQTINFSESEDGISHLDMLRGAMRDAEQAVDRWYGESKQSFFTWSILSVRNQEYLESLPRIKDAIRGMESELECSDADRLIRFNVQIYPVGVER